MGLCVEDARKAFFPAVQSHLQHARNTLLGLLQHGVSAVPQVLLLEGGIEAERQAMALWWASLQHCTHILAENASSTEPCGQCGDCLRIGLRIHSDVLAYDGRISNTADLESPGPVRALNKENAQALKSKIGDTARSGHKRVVIISGIDTTRAAAANALLKVLEEPSPTTIFVLLTAQREQILPTLVSRSWVYTLPWPHTHHVDTALTPWETALATFMQRGSGWWNMTSGKGSVSPEMATQVLLLCQKRLVTSLAGNDIEQSSFNTRGPLSACLQGMDAEQRMTLCHYIDNAQEALQYNVNPARVLDALAVQLCTLYQRK